jgi:hypothetical protein
VEEPGEELAVNKVARAVDHGLDLDVRGLLCKPCLAELDELISILRTLAGRRRDTEERLSTPGKSELGCRGAHVADQGRRLARDEIHRSGSYGPQKSDRAIKPSLSSLVSGVSLPRQRPDLPSAWHMRRECIVRMTP